MKKYLIIEKDLTTNEYIKNTLDRYDDVMFLGYTANQDEALTLIFKYSPDIIFINVDNTLENIEAFLLEIALYSKRQHVFIALSSSENYAYRAFRHNFFDYLLKPLIELTIERCLLKYKKTYESKPCETICIKSNKDFQYLNSDEILFLKADNNTTDFYMQNGTIIATYKTLKTFENTLPSNFLRVHKSYIINSKGVSRIQYGNSTCTIKNHSHKIPFTKTFIHNINFINTLLSNKAFSTLN